MLEKLYALCFNERMNENPKYIPAEKDDVKSKGGILDRLRLAFSPALYIETSEGWKKVVGPPALIKTLGTSIGGSQLRINRNGGVDIIGMGLNMPSLEVGYRSINGFSFDQLIFQD